MRRAEPISKHGRLAATEGNCKAVALSAGGDSAASRQGWKPDRAETPIVCLGGSVHDSPAQRGTPDHENENSYGDPPKKEAGPMPCF